MNIKNLPVKFILLSFVILLCLWALNWLPVLRGTGPGLVEGLDLAGGHSMDFKLLTTRTDVESLQEQMQELVDALEAAETEDRRAELQAEIDDVQQRLDSFGDRQVDMSYLLDDAITNLKLRLDPNGLLSLEFRPLRNNSIRVRMPAAREETRQAEEAFRLAMDDLREGNISRDQVRRLRLTEDRRLQVEQIERLAAGNARRADALAALIEAHHVELMSRQAFEQASEPEARQQARIDLADAAHDYDLRLREVLATNINIENLRSMLQRNYVTRREARALAEQRDGEQKIRARREALQAFLDAQDEQFPDRREQIAKAVELFGLWDEQRRALGDPSDLKRLIRKAGVLEFRIAPFSPFAGSLDETGREDVIDREELSRFQDILRNDGPNAMAQQAEDYRWLPIREGGTFPSLIVAGQFEGGQKYLLVYNRPDKVMLADRSAAGWQLTRARATRDANGQPIITFDLDAAGGEHMDSMTGRNRLRHMAIVLDGVAFSAPVIQSQIGAHGQISGVPPEDIPELVRTLNAGWLALDPNPTVESSFGPGIGQDNKERGFRATIWALIAVAAFMLIYYLLAGTVANVALLVNIILILGFMSIFRVVLTLPGIAGLVLTIGIAVDANVLIFERLREEQAKGQSLSMTIKNAYQRAFSAIFDANLTTLITCVILGWISTTEIRGFAITLGLGVAFSMFTALVVTRWVFQAMLDGRLITGSIKMLQIIGTPKVDWIAKRHLFWGLSTVMIVLGIVSLVWQGGNLLGIQFTSGTQVTIRFKPDAMLDVKGTAMAPSDGLVRDAIARQADEEGADGDRLLATALVEQRLVPTVDAVRAFLENYDAVEAGEITRDQWREMAGNENFFDAMNTDDNDDVITKQELLDNLPASMYQLSTTETNVELVTAVIREAFGDQLQSRQACRYELVTGERAERLGVDLADNGLTKVRRVSDSDFRDLLNEYEGGVVFKIVDVFPHLSIAELTQRLDEMRYQPDFADRPLAESIDVVGLTEVGDGQFSSFLVFSQPPETSAAQWTDFAASERLLLEEALLREESMEIINFDAQIAGQAQGLAFMAIVLSCVAIVLYLWLRFGSIQWGLAAVVCLAHDVIIVIGLVAASGWVQGTIVGKALGIQSFKIDLFMVAAFLTVIGYSVNDTIVVFDRIRENRGKLPALTPQIINRSINQTLSRTLLTSSTTLIVVIILYLWGGPGVIHAFSYALLAGVLFGTYSSIAVASPLLLGFKKAFSARAALPEEQEAK